MKKKEVPGNVGLVWGCDGPILTITLPLLPIHQGEICKLKIPNGSGGVVYIQGEVLEIRSRTCIAQFFDDTKDVCMDLEVEFTGKLLSVKAAPGILGTLTNGLQYDLKALAKIDGTYLRRGSRSEPFSMTRKWEFTPTAEIGKQVVAGEYLGWVQEFSFRHQIMVPFDLKGQWTLETLVPSGSYAVTEVVATVKNDRGDRRNVTMIQEMPVKDFYRTYVRRVQNGKDGSKILLTGSRIIDGFLPIPIGGSVGLPGPFGAGKTVLEQFLAKFTQVDIVIICYVGERAVEIVEMIKEFGKLLDPKTGRPLSERTVQVGNPSDGPVAAREAAVYAAVTLAEFYRCMGLSVLVLIDSTSRWAQSLREQVSPRGQIPAAGGFPGNLAQIFAYLFARAGNFLTVNGEIGSITLVGTVSPAGGDFSDPVVQVKSKIDQTFWGLSGKRAASGRYPAIELVGESFSNMPGLIPEHQAERFRELKRKADEEIKPNMLLIGEEAIGMEAFLCLLLAELFDSVFLQQDSFDRVDACCSPERIVMLGDLLYALCFDTTLLFDDKVIARKWMGHLTQKLRTWNKTEFKTAEEVELWQEIKRVIEEGATECVDKK